MATANKNKGQTEEKITALYCRLSVDDDKGDMRPVVQLVKALADFLLRGRRYGIGHFTDFFRGHQRPGAVRANGRRRRAQRVNGNQVMGAAAHLRTHRPGRMRLRGRRSKSSGLPVRIPGSGGSLFGRVSLEKRHEENRNRPHCRMEHISFRMPPPGTSESLPMGYG